MDAGLACRRYLLRHRDCIEPIDDAVRDHRDVAALVATFTRFGSGGILVRDEARPWRPLLHCAFDRARQFHAPELELDREHRPQPLRRFAPRETFIVIPLVCVLAGSMAGLRLSCGTSLWLPQTGEPLLDWLACQLGPPILHSQSASLRQQLAWRLHSQMVPERLCTLLDTRLDELLRLKDPNAQLQSTDGCFPLARH